LAALMALGAILLQMNLGTLAAIFIEGGIFVAMEETLEDSLCAELVSSEHHGIAFGMDDTVHGIGDFDFSIIVGSIWTAFGTHVAFGYSTLLFLAGSSLILRATAEGRRRS